ncbi:MAG: ABC transporter ATP-binding protein [Alcanivoracaceae bacterium]|nr:ABC transporter ATP-binding protein [Alcanivoracaceae bacterium]
MNPAIISIKNMTKSYQEKTVLNSLNWQIQKGDIIALLGKNGAGKSTLLETIMNLREFNSGELKLWDKNWHKLAQNKREKIAFVAQDTVGFEWMRVNDFLTYLGSFFPTWNHQYCDKLRDRWDLDPKQKVGDLSGGQTQILHVIQALSVKPELLILDEPVAHLDPSMRRGFISELIELACEIGTTVIFSSHIISDLERVANKVALLKDGQIEFYHEVELLKASIAHVKIAAEKSLEQTEYYANLINWQKHAQGATATIVKPMQQSLQNFIKNAPNSIEYIPMSLEDWYLEVSNASS